jgi:hypothetical protein
MQVHPYEILVRFNWADGEVAGGLRTITTEQRAFMVDENGLIVSRIDRGAADFPVDVSAETVASFIGDALPTIGAQLAAVTAANAALTDELSDARDSIVTLQAALASAQQQIQSLQAQPQEG